MGWWDKKSSGGAGHGKGFGDGDGYGDRAGNGAGNGKNLPVPARPNGMVPYEKPRTEITPFQEPGKPSRRAFLERQIADHIKANPDAVTRLIRKWLREDEE